MCGPCGPSLFLLILMVLAFRARVLRTLAPELVSWFGSVGPAGPAMMPMGVELYVFSALSHLNLPLWSLVKLAVMVGQGALGSRGK